MAATMPNSTNTGRKDFGGLAVGRMAAWLGDATTMEPALLRVHATFAGMSSSTCKSNDFLSDFQDGETTP